VSYSLFLHFNILWCLILMAALQHLLFITLLFRYLLFEVEPLSNLMSTQVPSCLVLIIKISLCLSFRFLLMGLRYHCFPLHLLSIETIQCPMLSMPEPH
jgi:hypothetical protein